jgi:NAD(P)H-dependent FMN reductase
MNKILILRANPRQEGYTRYLTDKLIAGIAGSGAEYRDINLVGKNINPCIGCYHCWTNDEGTCVHDDEMTEITEHLAWCDVVLFATPLYHFSISSLMKVVLERTLPITRQGIERGPSGNFRNLLRDDKWKGKNIAVLCAAALRGEHLFDGVEKTLEMVAEGIHFRNAGLLRRPETYLLQFALAKPKTMKIIETGLERAGYELANEGCFSQKTINDVATTLAVDTNYFQMYSNIYWEHVGRDTTRAASVESIRDLVLHDVRILMNEFARSFDPVAGARLRTVMVFDFPDKSYTFRIAVKDAQCAFSMEDDLNADMRVTADSIIWAKAFTRELSMRDALMSGKIRVEGDKSLFMKLERYFPPPNN